MRRRHGFALVVAVACFAALGCAARAQAGVEFRTVVAGAATYHYEVYVPSEWTRQQQWPVILFLHGAGHRGRYDARAPVALLAPRFATYREQSAAIVVFPRCRENTWWSDPEMEAMALQALDQTVREFNGDRSRIYLTGLSMGGYGTWWLASRHPGKFAAIVPVCGGIRTPSTIAIPPVSTAEDPYADVSRRLGRTPVWVFHGSADETISVEESRKMVEALKAAGGNVRYTEYKGVGHNSWDSAYAEPDFFTWLLSHRVKAN